MEKLLEIAKIVRPHGVKGAVKIVKYIDDNFSHFSKVYIGQKLQPANMKLVSKLNNDACVVMLDIIKSCEDAEKFRNQSIYIDRTEYEEYEDKIYLTDLINKPLVTTAGKELGVLVDIDDYGASSILTFKCGAVSYQLPYVEAILTYNQDLDSFVIDEQVFKDIRI